MFTNARLGTALLACAGVALASCTTMGTGTGSESPGNAAVTFSWESKDGGRTGTISARLADGRTFTGPYLQATSTVLRDHYDPMWSGWSYRWSDWDGWDGFPAFTTFYSGRVLANLQAADGQRMRCQFYLNDPVGGMPAGGQGNCQLAGGETVDAVFPRG